MDEFKITLPTSAEMRPEREYYVTDYAVATGAKCGNHHYRSQYGNRHFFSCSAWLRERTTHVEGIRTIGFSGDSSIVNQANTHGITIMPRLKNPGLADYDVLPDKNILTLNGFPVLYPNTLVPDFGNVTNKIGGLIPQPISYEHAQPIHSNFDAYKLVKDHCHKVGNRFFVKVENAITDVIGNAFSNGQSCVAGNSYWFECEPIPAMKCDDGDIQILHGMATTIFDSLDKYVHLGITDGRELDTDNFDIGKFMKETILNDFNKSIIIQDPAAKTDLHLKLKNLHVGANVKITCEGRTGIVKAINTTEHIATVLVDGKHLKYRIADLKTEQE